MNYKIKISKLDDNRFLINKNKNFIFLIRSTHSTYQRIISDLEKHSKDNYKENELFINLIVNLFSDSEKSEVSLTEITLLKNWIDAICVILLERQMDFKDKEILKYFRIARNFNKSISDLILEKENTV